MDWRKRSESANCRLRPLRGVGEVSLDERAEAEVVVQLTRQQQSSIGGDRRAPELDAKLGVERELEVNPSNETRKWVTVLERRTNARTKPRRFPTGVLGCRDPGLPGGGNPGIRRGG